jgi:hypothetical protein
VSGRFSIEPASEWRGHCDCCGNESRRIWGYVRGGGNPVAAYFVHWTVGAIGGHPPNFDLIVGTWGDGTDRSGRVLISMDYQLLGSGPAFRVIDAAPRLAGFVELAATALQRSEVIGQPVAEQAFAIADVVLASDSRAHELLGDWTIEPQ